MMPQSEFDASICPLQQGFLPPTDPLTAFDADSEWSILDQIGLDLPSLLMNRDCRRYLASRRYPDSDQAIANLSQPALQLAYVRLAFIASAYINQIRQPSVNLLPATIARPLVAICQRLKRPPILSYDGYALYNWKRFEPTKPIQLGNIDTLQNFVHLYDERWFILVHVEIEALAAPYLQKIAALQVDNKRINEQSVGELMALLLSALPQQISVLKRIPEHMSAEIYFNQFRPYIRFFENVRYEGVDSVPPNQRGETGAQSAILPTLVSLLKIPHQPTELTNHLLEMRQYMPHDQRQFIARTEALTDIRPFADKAQFNSVLEAIAEFREIHYGWAQQYIYAKVKDPRGTGGTPYMGWLKQLIDETRAYQNP